MTHSAFRVGFFFGLILLKINDLQSQDFLMQAWYWDYPKNGCSGYSGQNWAVNLNGKAAELHNGGFTWLWMPPASRASFGQCSNGYDPKDLFDLGEFGLGRTGFGTRTEVNTLFSTMNSVSSGAMKPVADVVYNHRDGGRAEHNPPVTDWITNFPVIGGAAPYPSDRFRCILPIGGSTGRNAGTYKFRLSSKTGWPDWNNYTYRFYTNTNVVGWQGLPDLTENEAAGNGGADCSQGNDPLTLGRNINATVETGGSCNTDEFQVTVGAGQFNPAGDTIYMYMANTGGYSDHRIYGIRYTPTGGSESEVGGSMFYQTYTNFNGLPSGRGGMNHLNFRPNGIFPTTLTGPEQEMLFFYDYEQSQQTTKDTLNIWSKWLWNLNGGTGFKGFRMDAVKHFPPSFASQIFNYLAAQSILPGMIVGEFFDGNAGLLNGWVNAVYAGLDPAASSLKIRAFDFALRNSLKSAVENPGPSNQGKYDVRNLFQEGMVDGAAGSGFNTITFVNNHDFRGPGEPVQTAPMLAYAYILTNNKVGAPCVFYPDYFGVQVPNSPLNNFKLKINNLITLHKTWITNATTNYLSRHSTPYYQYFVPGMGESSIVSTFQLNGGVGGKVVIVSINFSNSPLDYYQEVEYVNGVQDGTTFTDMLGFSGTPYTNITPNNEIHITLPARSYSVWVQDVQTPLPLEWVKMGGRFVEKNRAEIAWTVAQEVGNRGFEVEKSTDGGLHFEKIGFVPSLGDSPEPRSYSFIDEKFTESEAWFRLRQIDLDGQSTRSEIVSVRNPARPAVFQIQPNPIGSQPFRLVFDEALFSEKELTAEILLADGRVIGRFSGEADSLNFELNRIVNGHPAGIFWIKIGWPGGGQVLKIVRG